MKYQKILQHGISMLFFAFVVSLVMGGSDFGGDKSGILNLTSSSKQWFHGGNLHNATVGQWKSATYRNKLATSADWLAATLWKGYLKSPSDFDKIKVKAQMLVNPVDGVVTVDNIDFMQVAEIAVSVMMMSNDLGPY